MIAFLSGRIAAIGFGHALIEVSGVGYRLEMSTRSLGALPSVGDTALVHTHLHVREDELTLFGFGDTAERDAFEALLSVSGVGPRVALATLSALGPDDLAAAVGSEDVARLSGVPGVGKKTAQRMIVDLGGKLSPGQGHAVDTGSGGAAVTEARDALIGMGFTQAEADAALKESPVGSSVHEALKHALGRLGGRS